jgi:hypothetical protein
MTRKYLFQHGGLVIWPNVLRAEKRWQSLVCAKAAIDKAQHRQNWELYAKRLRRYAVSETTSSRKSITEKFDNRDGGVEDP